MDILAVDQQNRVYNIEIQRNDKGAGVKRARYNSSLIDANVTEPGDQYQELNETYVIFITENDVLGENLPIYHVDRIIRETGKMFNDESHIIYVNSQIKDETALGKLMHDFACTNTKDMYYEVLADRVHYFKEDEKGVAVMCKAMEDMRNESSPYSPFNAGWWQTQLRRYCSIHRVNHRGNRKDSFREEKCIIVWQFNTDM